MGTRYSQPIRVFYRLRKVTLKSPNTNPFRIRFVFSTEYENDPPKGVVVPKGERRSMAVSATAGNRVNHVR
jgi:hypothetical protein